MQNQKSEIQTALFGAAKTKPRLNQSFILGDFGNHFWGGFLRLWAANRGEQEVLEAVLAVALGPLAVRQGQK